MQAFKYNLDALLRHIRQRGLAAGERLPTHDALAEAFGLSKETISRIPEYVGQEHVPRLAGFKWRRI